MISNLRGFSETRLGKVDFVKGMVRLMDMVSALILSHSVEGR